MKKQLLLLVILSLTMSGWAQISEYEDLVSGNSVELESGSNPGFVSLNNKFYFIGNNSTDVLYSIDTHSNLVTEFDTAGLVGSNSLEALTVFNGQLYFVASNNGDINTKRLYRLLGNNAAQLTSNNVLVTGYDEMLVWDGELYFSGKLDSTSDNALLKYDGNNFTLVNNVTPGVDFDPKRLTLNSGNNSLFFFTRVSDFGASEALWRLNIAQKNAGNTTISQVGAVDFIDFFSFAPPLTEFANRIYTIGRTENDSEGFLYQGIGTTLSRVNNAIGYSPNSFNDVQTNNGGTVYNNKLAIFRSSNSGSFVNDKLVLLSTDNSTQEFNMPTDVSGAQFFEELNDALIFYAIDQNGSSIESLYEFRENTIIDVLPEIRVIHDYLNSQSQRPYFGNIFNGKFYFYGASVNDINRRVLHEYDPEILNYGPFVDNQEELNFLGSLGYKTILDQLSIQDGTAIKGGTVINSLTPLADLEEIRYLLIDGVDIVDLKGLGNLNRVYDFFEVFQNSELTSLDGLNTNLIFDTASPDINNNILLSNFCALQPWAANNPGFSGTFTTSGNAYNPSFSQLQSTTTCQAEICTPLAVDSNFEEFLENTANTFFDINGVAIPNADISNGANDGFVCQEGIERIAEIDFSPTTSIDFVNIDRFTSMRKFILGAIPSATPSSLNLSQNLALEEVNIAPNSFNDFVLPTAAGSNLNKVSLGPDGTFTWPTTNFTIDLSNSPLLSEFISITTDVPIVDLSNSVNLTDVTIVNTNINDLFLFGCSKLTDLNLDGATLLTALDLSNMPDLNEVVLRNSTVTFLSIDNTGLENIFFTEQSALEEINITNNPQLTAIDFFQNAGVPPINLARVNLNNNDLSNLDLSTLINIEELDVTQNLNLNSLIGLSDLSILRNIKTYATSISTLDLSTNNGALINIEVGNTNFSGSLDFLDLRNNNLIYNGFSLSSDNNPGLCIQVNSVQDAEEAVNQGFWSVDADPHLFKLDCNVTCTPVNFADANLQAFFVDPGNTSRILDGNGNPVTGLVIDGEVCAEKAIEVFGVDLDGGYNNAPITSLGGLEEFTNLAELRMVNAQLSGDIDLRPLTSLEIFNADENAITSVTVSEVNSVLRRISIFEQGAGNTLTALNLGGTMPALNSLDISTNGNLNAIDLTRTPLLDTFQSFATGITRLDFTALQSAGTGNFFISDTNGTLQEIDLRNNNPSFVLADLELDATGHPNLSCVLVNAGDLATAQNNVQNSTWQFDNTDVVGTVCATCTPVNFADANLKAFFLDSGNSSRILDGNGNPVSGLVIGGEVCAEKAIEIFEINLDGGYNNAPITSLGGLEEFTNLGRLNIGGAQLTGSVDLSTLVNLEEFEGTGNEITALTASSANTKLTRIEVSFQGTNEDVLTAVNLNGASIPLLESLSLQNNRNLTSIDLTKTPSLASFRPDNTAISRLDLTLIDDLDQLDTFYLKDDENDGSLQEIDLGNGLGNFNVANFVLDATGHPNLRCVLVNASDLATAQNNVQNNTWQFDNTDVVKTVCDPSGPYEVEVYIDVDDAQQDGSGTYTYFHDEDSANQIALNFNLVGATSTEVAQYQINITTRGNTADNGLDYEARSGIITLTTVDGSDTNDLETQLIQILGDNNIEDVESFYIDITPADNSIVLKDFTNGLGTTLGTGETLTFEVFVRDNDVPEVRIATTDDIATEDGPTNAEYSIGLFEPSSNTTLFNETGSVISINYSTSGTAIAGTDYTSLPGVFEIPEGESSAGLIIFALDDDLQDGNRELTVTLFGTNVGNIATGNNALAMITIVDNDSGDPDADNDGITDSLDNCSTQSNPDQADLDGDNQGDVCDEDDDGDGVNDGEDAFPRDISESSDNDNDGLGDNADTDDDNDGVLDVNDDCQYVSGPPAENGCPEEIISFDQEAIQLVVLGETCEGENNGSFEVTIDNEDHTFTINLDGNVVGTASLNNPFEQNNLANGSYQVCLTVPELPDYAQCFGVVVSTYERLAVNANGIDATNLKASFSVQGSKNYEVSVNEKFYNFKFETTSNKILEIPVDKGQNIVSITGESDCQGIFKDVIVIGNVTIFPNPVKDILNFKGFTSEGQAQINVFALSGSLVKSTKEQLENGGIMIHIPDLPKGIYLVKVISEIEVIEFKIIKE